MKRSEQGSAGRMACQNQVKRYPSRRSMILRTARECQQLQELVPVPLVVLYVMAEFPRHRLIEHFSSLFCLRRERWGEVGSRAQYLADIVQKLGDELLPAVPENVFRALYA